MALSHLGTVRRIAVGRASRRGRSGGGGGGIRVGAAAEAQPPRVVHAPWQQRGEAALEGILKKADVLEPTREAISQVIARVEADRAEWDAGQESVRRWGDGVTVTPRAWMGPPRGVGRSAGAERTSSLYA